MGALQQGHRVLDQETRRVARLRRRVGARIGQLRADNGKLYRVALLIGHAAREHVRAQLVEELHRRAAVADARFVHQVVPERRAHGVAEALADRSLPGGGREAREAGVEIVQRVRIVGELLVVEGAREPVIVREVEVHARGRVAPHRLHRDVEGIALQVDVGV